MAKKQDGGINQLLNSNIAKYIPELHMIDRDYNGKLRQMRYCGPFTKTVEKFIYDKFGTIIGTRSPPINDLDRACENHDAIYDLTTNPYYLRMADRSLIHEANYISHHARNQTNRDSANLVKRLIGIKIWSEDD